MEKRLTKTRNRKEAVEGLSRDRRRLGAKKRLSNFELGKGRGDRDSKEYKGEDSCFHHGRKTRKCHDLPWPKPREVSCPQIGAII